MSPTIQLNQLSFTYDMEKYIFSDLSMTLPGGVTTFIGQNGTGKSTLLLLAGGRLLPQKGSVSINGVKSNDITDENERNKLVSFIFQNMEFESEDPVGDLFTFVCEQGNYMDDSLVKVIVREFSLETVLNKRFQENSKGDMQKICIAFSLLYGSPVIMMDEPVFALDHGWKDKVLSFLKDFVKEKSIALYYSIHELDLSQKYSENALLFHKDGSIDIGPTSQILVKDKVEEAYQVPMEMMYQREHLFREHLQHPGDISNLPDDRVQVLE